MIRGGFSSILFRGAEADYLASILYLYRLKYQKFLAMPLREQVPGFCAVSSR